MTTEITFAGLTLKNPIIPASGTFGFGLEFEQYGDLKKLGGFVVKGLSLKERIGNNTPRLAETPAGMLNAIGIQNPGVEYFIRETLPKLPYKDTCIFANLYGTNAEEFSELADILSKEEGIAALEVNVSCPNVKAGGIAFGQDISMITQITEAVKKKARSKPVIVKLSPNVTDIALCARAAEMGGADALSLINTLSGMAVNLKTKKPSLANTIGGLSGPAIKPVALRCVHQVYQAVKIPIIGMGGITCAEDILEFLLVGATAIQIGTGNFIRPDLSFSLVDELPKIMKKYSIDSLAEYSGTLIK